MNIADPFSIERDTPFPHLYSPGFFSADLCSEIYDYFETANAWGQPEGAAPDDGAIMYINGGLPASLQFLNSAETHQGLKDWLSGVYNISFGSQCDLIANKMLVGQGIRPHTDHHDAAPSHRIVIFVTRNWTWEHGGGLWLLKGEDGEIQKQGHTEYPPLPGDAITFGISPRSYHAVLATTQGVRYSLTYSFYPPAP